MESSVHNHNQTADMMRNKSSTSAGKLPISNIATLTRRGQETVQDIVVRTRDVFWTLNTIHPPNGTSRALLSSEEHKIKLKEQLRAIGLLFRRLKLIYESCSDHFYALDSEVASVESLIPYTCDEDCKKTNYQESEELGLCREENKALLQRVSLKNRHLLEMIMRYRAMVWQINVMLTPPAAQRTKSFDF